MLLAASNTLDDNDYDGGGDGDGDNDGGNNDGDYLSWVRIKLSAQPFACQLLHCTTNLLCFFLCATTA